MRTIVSGQQYRHYKGGMYKVIGVAKHSENPNEEFVVYQKLEDENGKTRPGDALWIRPKEKFLEMIEREGKKLYRFEEVAVKKGGNNKNKKQ